MGPVSPRHLAPFPTFDAQLPWRHRWPPERHRQLFQWSGWSSSSPSAAVGAVPVLNRIPAYLPDRACKQGTHKPTRCRRTVSRETVRGLALCGRFVRPFSPVLSGQPPRWTGARAKPVRPTASRVTLAFPSLQALGPRNGFRTRSAYSQRGELPHPTGGATSQGGGWPWASPGQHGGWLQPAPRLFCPSAWPHPPRRWRPVPGGSRGPGPICHRAAA